MIVIHGPAYVVGAQQICWKCGTGNEVVTLACTAISVDGEDIERAEPGEAFHNQLLASINADLIRKKRIATNSGAIDHGAEHCEREQFFDLEVEFNP
jgi:hypothetical protein